ncbi:hypothetical protein C8R46DRAFT_1234146 [Mycena filopes]|nr:hypothetical protein C8R46DRAFT_1234146 [Mycena filopes]
MDNFLAGIPCEFRGAAQAWSRVLCPAAMVGMASWCIVQFRELFMDPPIQDSSGPPGTCANPFVLSDSPPKTVHRKRKLADGKRRIAGLPSRAASSSSTTAADNRRFGLRARFSPANSAAVNVTPPAPKRIIFGGPPSEIRQDADGASMARRVFAIEGNAARLRALARLDGEPRGSSSSSSSAAGPSGARGTQGLSPGLSSFARPRTDLAALRQPTVQALLPPEYHVGGIREPPERKRPPPGSIAALGRRTRRQPALTHQDLWVGGVGPVDAPVALRHHHKCGICQHIKSHPVSYACGHSHCYVCIRLWLERDFRCPDCKTTMFEPPFRHWAEEGGLEVDYVRDYSWTDLSVVTYSYNGLIFPREFL